MYGFIQSKKGNIILSRDIWTCILDQLEPLYWYKLKCNHKMYNLIEKKQNRWSLPELFKYGCLDRLPQSALDSLFFDYCTIAVAIKDIYGEQLIRNDNKIRHIDENIAIDQLIKLKFSRLYEELRFVISSANNITETMEFMITRITKLLEKLRSITFRRKIIKALLTMIRS